MPSAAYLDLLRERLDYEAIFRRAEDRLGPFRVRNGQAIARCLWHEDTTPSLSLDMRRGLFHCFGCSTAGDIFTFWQRIQGLQDGGAGFPEAVRQLSVIAGMDPDVEPLLPPTPEREAELLAAWVPPATVPNPEDRIIDERIVDSCHERLLAEPDQLWFLQDRRGLTEETVRAWRLGRYENRFTIPIRNDDGQCVNLRRYKPNAARAGEKMLSWRAGFGSARLWPLESFREPSGPVYLMEGEMDCLLALQAGLPAVTCTGGAGTWSQAWNERFRGRAVIIVYDCDQAGRTGARRVAEELAEVASSVRIVDLGLSEPAGADFTDYLHGHAIPLADFFALVARTDPFVLAPPTATPVILNAGVPADILERSDLAFAYRLKHHAGEDLCYVRGLGWHLWNGIVWEGIDEGCVYQIAAEPARGLVRVAAEEPDADRRNSLLKQAMAGQSLAKLKAAATLARPLLEADLDSFDADPRLLNCANGVINLATGQLARHDREQRHTKLVPVPFVPDAPAPRFEQMLRRIFGQDEALIRWVQEALGYTLTGLNSEQCFFVWWGTGQNGKSTLLELIMRVLGTYATTTPFSTFLEHPADRIPNDLARLTGARLVGATESDDGRRLAEATIKNLTGGDRVAARFLHREYFQFTPQFKVVLVTNYRPEVRGQDNGFWRRVRLVPFAVQIPEGERIHNLLDLLWVECEGVLAWLVNGARRWCERGRLTACQAVSQATESYR